MKRLIPAALVVFIISLFVLSSSAASKSGMNGTDPTYQSQWTKVDSLERKGLYRMALEEVGKYLMKPVNPAITIRLSNLFSMS